MVSKLNTEISSFVTDMSEVVKKVDFIDFGLGEKNSEIESKGVDLHVLM